jgi:hypothetical protein
MTKKPWLKKTIALFLTPFERKVTKLIHLFANIVMFRISHSGASICYSRHPGSCSIDIEQERRVFAFYKARVVLLKV